MPSEHPMDGRSAAPTQPEVHDREALQAFWQEHRRWVAAVILAYKPRSVELDDLLQEVALTLISKVTTVRDPANLRAWLRVVAVNAARGAGRAERLRRMASTDCDAEVAAPGACSSTAIEVADHSHHVLDRVMQLPEEYREPLMLKVQGLRSRQIAQMLNINEATVDTRVSRARRMLREMIDVETDPALTFPTACEPNGSAHSSAVADR